MKATFNSIEEIYFAGEPLDFYSNSFVFQNTESEAVQLEKQDHGYIRFLTYETYICCWVLPFTFEDLIIQFA